MKTEIFRSPFAGLALIALAAGMTSCATVDKNRGTYLSDTSQMQVSPKDKHTRTYRDATPAAAIGEVSVGKVAYLAPDAGLTPEQKQVLVQRTESALRERFATKWHHDPAAGQQNVEIRGAITAAEKSNVWVNVVADAVLNFPVSMGGVTVELEAISQPGGQRIAAGQYIIPGRPWQLFSSLTQTGQAREGIDKAADKFYTLVTGQEPPDVSSKQMMASNNSMHYVGGKH